MTPRRRRAATVLAIAAATAGTMIAMAPAADAGAYSVAYTGGDGVALRSAPTANARLSPMVVWRDGTPITIICQTWSPDGVGPRANHIFNRVVYPARSEPTWIPDAYVSGSAAANVFTTGIARCDASAPAPVAPTPAADTAIAWMNVRMGSHQFDGYCLAAVYQAYLAAGRDITAGLPTGPARDSAYSYWTIARNRHPGDRNPPRGALVFFRSAAGAPGHVAISLGGGQMITTWDGRTAGIHTMPISGYDPARYLGWVGV
ncbi:NlpC/P60 family protein [Pseudonocardia sp.]|uniref:NlpC/P60 family protein n=1 Tax=Pseudonocardia sp. TaxID=60912 RepID=UPI003D0A9013